MRRSPFILRSTLKSINLRRSAPYPYLLAIIFKIITSNKTSHLTIFLLNHLLVSFFCNQFRVTFLELDPLSANSALICRWFLRFRNYGSAPQIRSKVLCMFYHRFWNYIPAKSIRQNNFSTVKLFTAELLQLFSKVLNNRLWCMLRLTHQPFHSFDIRSTRNKWSCLWASPWAGSSRFHWSYVDLSSISRLAYLRVSKTFAFVFRRFTCLTFAFRTASAEYIWKSSCNLRQTRSAYWRCVAGFLL